MCFEVGIVTNSEAPSNSIKDPAKIEPIAGIMIVAAKPLPRKDPIGIARLNGSKWRPAWTGVSSLNAWNLCGRKILKVDIGIPTRNPVLAMSAYLYIQTLYAELTEVFLGTDGYEQTAMGILVLVFRCYILCSDTIPKRKRRSRSIQRESKGQWSQPTSSWKPLMTVEGELLV